MIKAFISHSSKQKPFVESLAKILGKDSCIIDCYDFEAGYKSLDEIYKCIDKCTVFVFLVSKDSLNSEWCKKELSKAHSNLSSGELSRFWPFIIDENVRFGDTPEWIYKENCYNLKYFRTPKVLAREIEQKFRSIIWKENPIMRNRETLTIGRNRDIDIFEQKYYSERKSKLRSVIISGRNGVGKEAFARQCMQKIGKDIETIPFQINLSPKDGIEMFLLLINAITGTYSEEQMKDVVLPSDMVEKTHYAVIILNELLGFRTVLFIEDDRSVVLSNRALADWFVNIITDSELSAQIGILVQSKITPKPIVEVSSPQLISIALEPLQKSDRKKLFYQLIENYNLQNIVDKDVDFFVEKLNQSPVQLIRLAQALQSQDLMDVKSCIDDFVSLGDKKLKPIFDMFTDGDEKEMLIVLSKFDFVSFDVLKDIYENRYEEAMSIFPKIIANGLAATFGPSACFVRLDYALSDYIKRNHMALPSDFELHVNDILENYLTQDCEIDLDVSVFLINTRTRILKGKATDSDFLVPSVVVKSIVELYNDQKYKEVISLCEYVLKECRRYNDEVIREIRYWYCSALCREQMNEEFYREVQNINGADHKFLRGFYLRIEGRPADAEKWYKEALVLSPNMQRAKREYVSSLLEQRKYDEALAQAKDNYYSRPENTYHAHAYFRCLIKKYDIEKDDKEELVSLMKQVQSSHSPKKAELYCAMQLEYNLIFSNRDVEACLREIAEAENRFPNSHNIGRVANDYKYKQQLVRNREYFRED